MGSLAEPLPITAPDPMQPTPYRVVATHPESADVTTLSLVPVDAALPVALPGQFMTVWVFGVGEIPISVSRMGVAGEVLLTVRTVGRTSAAMVGSAVGDVMGLRGPFGTAWPVAAAAGRDIVVMAGGLGIAPLRMAIDALVAAQAGQVTVILGTREPAQLLFGADLDRWRAAGASVHVTVDAADRTWNGAVGTATAMLQRLGVHHDMAFVCGPEMMMTSGARAVIALGAQPHDVWVSLERNMHCGIGHCGRCQLGPHLLCRDGAVVRWDTVDELLEVRGR
ncbi:MAG: FAD/NAD(P)-binding protein [Actinomycetota bacterium]|nr:FAD/NAD(P)-binding protein [Actinomycetota bacterium]